MPAFASVTLLILVGRWALTPVPAERCQSGRPALDMTSAIHLILIDHSGLKRVPAERCQSGRSGRSRKPLSVQAFRGFESLSLRHLFPGPRGGGNGFIANRKISLAEYLKFATSRVGAVIALHNLEA